MQFQTEYELESIKSQIAPALKRMLEKQQDQNTVGEKAREMEQCTRKLKQIETELAVMEHMDNDPECLSDYSHLVKEHKKWLKERLECTYTFSKKFMDEISKENQTQTAPASPV